MSFWLYYIFFGKFLYHAKSFKMKYIRSLYLNFFIKIFRMTPKSVVRFNVHHTLCRRHTTSNIKKMVVQLIWYMYIQSFSNKFASNKIFLKKIPVTSESIISLKFCSATICNFCNFCCYQVCIVQPKWCTTNNCFSWQIYPLCN